MPLYRNAGTNLPQMANSAMSSATHAMASQTRQTTTVRKKEGNLWDDLYKGARAIGSLAGAANDVAGAVGKGIDLYDKVKVKSAYDDIAKTFAEGGYEAIQANPDMQGYHHSVALGNFVRDRANTEKGRAEMIQKADEAADRMYANWRAQAIPLAEAYQRGDMEAFRQGMLQLAADSGNPYKVELDQDGNFRQLFRSDKAGGWTPTGQTFTPEQAFQQMTGILRGERMTLRGAEMRLMPDNPAARQAWARNILNTVQGNYLNRIDPKRQTPLYDKNGNVGAISVIQNPMDNYGAKPRIFVYSAKDSRQIGVFEGYDQALQHGLSPFAPQKGKAERGGGGRAGSGGTASGFAVKDSSLFTKFATGTDPDSGEKIVDHRLAALLENVQRKTGKTGNTIIAAFEENTRRAMEQGMSQEQAQKAVMNIMAQRLNEGAQQNTKSPQQGTQGQPANTAGARVAGAVNPDNPAIAKIQKAAAEQGTTPNKRERDPNSVAGAQQSVLDFLEWFKREPRGASNNFGEEYE